MFRKTVFSLIIFFVCLYNLVCQENEITQIESLFKSGMLTGNHNALVSKTTDSAEVLAAKTYYKALFNKNIQESLLLHTDNFTKHSKQFYGQLSGLQLSLIDFINKEYLKALNKLDKINHEDILDAVYWKAKINQNLQKYHEATNISLSFIKKSPSHNKTPYHWLIVLESAYYTKNLKSFEKYYNDFSKHSEFSNYQAYLMIYLGILYETIDKQPNIKKASEIYLSIINIFPESQYRIQAEDRLFALRDPSKSDNTVITPLPPVSNIPVFNNKIVSRYDQLDKKKFYLQFGVFSTQKAADNYKSTLDKSAITSFVITKPVSGKTMYAVIQGPFEKRTEASEYQKLHTSKNYQSFPFFVD